MKKYTAADIAAHPEPDPHGRHRCRRCGGFTAAPLRVHGWCATGVQPGRYLDGIAKKHKTTDDEGEAGG